MICRDPCVGAAGQTAPTEPLEPPLKIIFYVVQAQQASDRHIRTLKRPQTTIKEERPKTVLSAKCFARSYCELIWLVKNEFVLVVQVLQHTSARVLQMLFSRARNG